MVVAEILTGIALVQKSVEFIKSNINTVSDIKGIAKQIDGFFEGEAQMNKKSGTMGIKEQFGIESTASDFIDRKLLEEKRTEQEAVRLRKVEKRQQQKEIIDTLQTMGIIFCVVAVIVICIVMVFKAYADTYEYTPKDYTRQQKIHQGKIILPIMTTCRLMKQKVFKDKMACIYVGAQKTYEMEFTDISIGCPRKYKCKLNPNGKEPNIDQVMESLRSIAKD
jgi:hypothetical protein